MRKATNTTLYDILGVLPSADCTSIKKAFRKAAIKCHPDKNPEDPDAPERFKQLNEAYEVLTDPEKRKTYDLYGIYGTFSDPFMESFCVPTGNNRRQQPHAGFTDPFAENFFSPNKPPTPKPREKCPDLFLNLPLTLEELCKGKDQQLSVTKDKLCYPCDGKGIVDSIQCSTCKGDRVVKVSEVIEVKIPVGSRSGHKIVISGAADQAIDKDPGNVVITISEKKHPIFTRSQDDLYMEKEITVLEALTGFKFLVPHVDGRNVIIKTHPGDVIKPGEKRVIPNEGMPLAQCPKRRGSLMVTFSVTFPEPGQLSTQQIKSLQDTFSDGYPPLPPLLGGICSLTVREVFLPQPLLTNKPASGTKRPRKLFEEGQGSNPPPRFCQTNASPSSVQCTQS